MKQNMAMKHLILLISITLTLSCSKKTSSMQLDQLSTSTNTETTAKSSVFPDDWLGYWEGDLNIYKESGKTMTIPMALDNATTDQDSVWTWAIIYGEDTIAGRRDYQLKTIDASKGHYVVDEKNSILLDAFLLDNNLISTFKVAGNYLHSSYELVNGKMHFTIHFFPEKEVRITGDTIHDGEDIPAVYSYKNTVYQTAILTKKNNLK